MSGKRAKAERKASAQAGDAPLTDMEQRIYQQRTQARGVELVNRLAAVLRAEGLPMQPGLVSVDWAGVLVYRLPQLVQRLSPRALFEALAPLSPDDDSQAVAAKVLEAEAVQLAASVVPMLRGMADDLEERQKTLAAKAGNGGRKGGSGIVVVKG